ncbi:hypothetical protein TorRG33x02_296100 [Trema orientale]|uniref:Uncharacterized protein n=1 Tax=Trema orientale TaxID=63057 RepID=A0A2P5C656_TREOI|nr:hypothetical protein TorRG33x02_296100 [Trema orientale]
MANSRDDLMEDFFQLQDKAAHLDDQLCDINHRSRVEIDYYLRCIEDLEEHVNSAFGHIVDIQNYVETKIAYLERSLSNAKQSLYDSFQEIARWHKLYRDLQSRSSPALVPIPVLVIVVSTKFPNQVCLPLLLNEISGDIVTVVCF